MTNADLRQIHEDFIEHYFRVKDCYFLLCSEPHSKETDEIIWQVLVEETPDLWQYPAFKSIFDVCRVAHFNVCRLENTPAGVDLPVLGFVESFHDAICWAVDLFRDDVWRYGYDSTSKDLRRAEKPISRKVLCATDLLQGIKKFEHDDLYRVAFDGDWDSRARKEFMNITFESRNENGTVRKTKTSKKPAHRPPIHDPKIWMPRLVTWERDKNRGLTMNRSIEQNGWGDHKEAKRALMAMRSKRAYDDNCGTRAESKCRK